VEAGDIITKVDGKVIEKSGDLPRIVGATKPGSKAVLQVFRRGGYRDVTVTVAEFEPDAPVKVAHAESGPAAAAGKSALGMTVSELSDSNKRDLKLRGGVKVDAVDGVAAKAGLREGDVILTLDNTEIADVKQFMAVAAKAEKARAVSVMVRRGEWVNYLVIRPGR
jgi:serine protease Do